MLKRSHLSDLWTVTTLQVHRQKGARQPRRLKYKGGVFTHHVKSHLLPTKNSGNGPRRRSSRVAITTWTEGDAVAASL